MKIGCVVKYFFLFVGVQIALVVVVGTGAFGKTIQDSYFDTVYWAWFVLGEYVLPSGPGGHAMPFGAMLGILLGVALYALVPATILCYFKTRSQRT